MQPVQGSSQNAFTCRVPQALEEVLFIMNPCSRQAPCMTNETLDQR